MRNKGLIIFLIILLVIIIAALISILVLCLNGTIDIHNFKINFGSRRSENIIYNETYNIEEINNIEINQDAGDIIFENEEGSNIRVEVYGEEKSNAEVSLTGNTLKIDYKNNGGFFIFNDVIGDIKIFIPQNYNGNIKIDTDAGEVKIKDLSEASLDMDCDAGNVEIEKIKNATIKCDAGNVKINNILNKCNIKVDSGNLDIKKVELKEDSTIKSNMGNINIREKNNIYVEGHVNLGKCNIDSNNRNAEVTLKIESDLGNINVR